MPKAIKNSYNSLHKDIEHIMSGVVDLFPMISRFQVSNLSFLFLGVLKILEISFQILVVFRFWQTLEDFGGLGGIQNR